MYTTLFQRRISKDALHGGPERTKISLLGGPGTEFFLMGAAKGINLMVIDITLFENQKAPWPAVKEQFILPQCEVRLVYAVLST